MGSDHGLSSSRGLGKNQLGGVIFGTKKATINECLSKQLFGLPSPHFMYVKNIDPGLPLFLFNFTDRTILGIFEAASSGQMNINPYAWTGGGSQRTQYPAQVQIRVKLHCKVLTENQYKPIIADNYYSPSHFWFELDHAQTNRLLSLLSAQAFSGPRTAFTPHSTVKQTAFLQEKEPGRYNIPQETADGRLKNAKSLPSNIKNIKTSTTSTPRTTHTTHSTNKQAAFLPVEKESAAYMPLDVGGGHLYGNKSFPSNTKDIRTCTTFSPRKTQNPHSTMKQAPFVPLEKESVRYMHPGVDGGHLNGTKSFPSNTKDTRTCKTIDEKELISMRLKDLAQKRKLVTPGPPSDVNYVLPKRVGPSSADCNNESVAVKNMTVEKTEDISKLFIAQLLEKVKELMASKAAQSDKINSLEEKIASQDQKLAIAQAEIKNLKGMQHIVEVQTCVGPQVVDDIKGKEIIPDSLPDDSILLVGGYDGVSWLSSLECYSPSQNVTKSLDPMHTERCYAAVSKLDGELFVFGGGTRGQWFDTVESYDPVVKRWTFCPPLNQKNGSLAGATVNDKIYALGGGNGVDCYSAVEMLDFDVGAWIPTRSMLQKRFALAAVELNGALYAVGGYDGNNYLSTAERFDPREHSWKKIENMSTVRGCPSMVVLNEKLYVLGGYDGNAMVSTVEIYDPRRGSWMTGEPMNHPRGFSAAAVAKDCVYVYGGLRNGEEINETVECYKEGRGWEITSGDCQRCFFSAIAL